MNVHAIRFVADIHGNTYTQSTFTRWSEAALLTRSLHLAGVWCLALCLVVQSLGIAAGGALCFGCPDIVDFGLGDRAVAPAAACTPANHCCSKDEPARTPPPAHSHHDGDDCDDGACAPSHECGCLDLVFSPGAATFGQPPQNFNLALSHLAVPAALPTMIDPPSAQRFVSSPGRARTGPLLVRSLSPSARQTVLLI